MIQVRAALDTEQLVYLYDLWEQWADEKGEDGFSRGGWMGQVEDKARSGLWMPLIAMNSVAPVGMLEMAFQRDPLDNNLYVYGGHAYVLPEYRRRGVFAGLYDACEQLARAMGADGGIAPLRDEGFLRQFYEKRGFKLTGYIMRREA